MENRTTFQSEDGTPCLRRSVTAFIDILGYKEYITSCFKSGTGQAELLKLRAALIVAYNDLKQKQENTIFENILSLQVRAFTDNLVIGLTIPEPIEGDDRGWGQTGIETVVFYVAFLQAELYDRV